MDEISIYECKVAREKLPERTLIAAVLQRAVMDLVDRNPDISEPAKEWIEFRGPGKGRLSVEDCCQVLDMDVERLRQVCLR